MEHVLKAIVALDLLVIGATSAAAQDAPLPVIDMHAHAIPAASQGPPPLAMCPSQAAFPARDAARPWPDVFMEALKNPTCADPIWSPRTDEELMRRTLAVLDRRNVYAVTSGPLELVRRWQREAPDRIIPAVMFNVATDTLSPTGLRRLYEAGEIVVFGEVTNQYAGVEPGDASFEPYLAVAEELDIPVGIHIGTGPPGAPYLGFENYRARLHSPLILEDALLRHPDLRVYVMHAGWPMLDDMLAVLWTHPQVYVGIGVIVYALPRAEFYRYLRTIVEAGFGKRVMFGSDQMIWPEAIDHAIQVIQDAPFLSAEQKRGILYDNAARFLRLGEAEIARHHGH